MRRKNTEIFRPHRAIFRPFSNENELNSTKLFVGKSNAISIAFYLFSLLHFIEMPRVRMAGGAECKTERERRDGGEGGGGEDELIDFGNHNKALLLMTHFDLSRNSLDIPSIFEPIK